MAIQQWLRCGAADPEGYQCVRFLSHEGPHQFRRCDWTDPAGYRCFLPPSHPGDHELAWFARPTAPGATHTVRFRGDNEAAAAQAEGELQELAFNHWFPVSQTYVPGSWDAVTWAVAILAVVIVVGIFVLLYMIRSKPAGALVVVYEFRPTTPTAPTTAAADRAELADAAGPRV